MGNGEFLTYYLDKMKAAEATAGKRLIDYVDLHWYPETYVKDNYNNNMTASPTTRTPRRWRWRRACKPRVRSGIPATTRTIGSPRAWGGPIMLIRRLKSTIAAHYPSTKLAFTEYGYGGGHDISGGVAEADVLGIFGREGVDMATSFNLPDKSGNTQYDFAALRAFRNYDGVGAHFGDTSIHAWPATTRSPRFTPP